MIAKNNYLKYHFTNYNRSDNYNGVRNSVENMMDIKGWNFNNKFYITDINSNSIRILFAGLLLMYSKCFLALKNIQVGGIILQKIIKQLIQNCDTLCPLSFAFDIWQVYVKSSEKKTNKWGITYFTKRR